MQPISMQKGEELLNLITGKDNDQCEAFYDSSIHFNGVSRSPVLSPTSNALGHIADNFPVVS
jgi:hypothetical protein